MIQSYTVDISLGWARIKDNGTDVLVGPIESHGLENVQNQPEGAGDTVEKQRFFLLLLGWDVEWSRQSQFKLSSAIFWSVLPRTNPPLVSERIWALQFGRTSAESCPQPG